MSKLTIFLSFATLVQIKAVEYATLESIGTDYVRKFQNEDNMTVYEFQTVAFDYPNLNNTEGKGCNGCGTMSLKVEDSPGGGGYTWVKGGKSCSKYGSGDSHLLETRNSMPRKILYANSEIFEYDTRSTCYPDPACQQRIPCSPICHHRCEFKKISPYDWKFWKKFIWGYRPGCVFKIEYHFDRRLGSNYGRVSAKYWVIPIQE